MRYYIDDEQVTKKIFYDALRAQVLIEYENTPKSAKDLCIHRETFESYYHRVLSAVTFTGDYFVNEHMFSTRKWA